MNRELMHLNRPRSAHICSIDGLITSLSTTGLILVSSVSWISSCTTGARTRVCTVSEVVVVVCGINRE